MGAGQNIKNSMQPSLLSVSNYSIFELFQNVNPVDGDFLKYIPDAFLSKEQIAAKNASVEKETDKISGYFEKQGGKLDSLWGDTNAVYEKLTALIKAYRAQKLGYRNGDKVSPVSSEFDDSAVVDGNLFSYSDMEKDLSIDWGDVFVGSREKNAECDLLGVALGIEKNFREFSDRKTKNKKPRKPSVHAVFGGERGI